MRTNMRTELSSAKALLARILVEGDDGDNIASSISNSELTTLYLATKREFHELVERADRVSRGSGGILSTSNRMFWASVLFTRLCVMAMSVRHILPDPKPRSHWDFSSTASLVRNLNEAYLVYFWLCQDEIIDEVRAGRFILMYLHDYGSRKRLFPHEFRDDDWVYADLVVQFDGNPWLATFTPTQRKVALKGEKTPFVQDDVLNRMGMDVGTFRSTYRFFSQHTHTGPMSFYRMMDHDRGIGVETRYEKRCMIMAIGSAFDILSRAIDGHLTIFPDAETRAPYLTRRQIELNVERNQGRLSQRKR